MWCKRKKIKDATKCFIIQVMMYTEGSTGVTLEWIEAMEICFMQPRGGIFLMAVVIWWPGVKSTRREWGVCVCPLCLFMDSSTVLSVVQQWWADALNYRLHKLSTTHTRARTQTRTHTHKLVLLSSWGLDIYIHSICSGSKPVSQPWP